MQKEQSEQTTQIGFLLYSLQSVNKEHMMRTLLGRYNTKVGLRYMAINTG